MKNYIPLKKKQNATLYLGQISKNKYASSIDQIPKYSYSEIKMILHARINKFHKWLLKNGSTEKKHIFFPYHELSLEKNSSFFLEHYLNKEKTQRKFERTVIIFLKVANLIRGNENIFSILILSLGKNNELMLLNYFIPEAKIGIESCTFIKKCTNNKLLKHHPEIATCFYTIIGILNRVYPNFNKSTPQNIYFLDTPNAISIILMFKNIINFLKSIYFPDQYKVKLKTITNKRILKIYNKDYKLLNFPDKFLDELILLMLSLFDNETLLSFSLTNKKNKILVNQQFQLKIQKKFFSKNNTTLKRPFNFKFNYKYFYFKLEREKNCKAKIELLINYCHFNEDTKSFLDSAINHGHAPIISLSLEAGIIPNLDICSIKSPKIRELVRFFSIIKEKFKFFDKNNIYNHCFFSYPDKLEEIIKNSIYRYPNSPKYKYIRHHVNKFLNEEKNPYSEWLPNDHFLWFKAQIIRIKHELEEEKLTDEKNTATKTY